MKKDASSKLMIIITLINMLLAVTALAKDIFMASYLGTTENSDAFTLAFFITDMIGNNLIASAAGVSCIPFFTKIKLNKEKDFLYKSLISTNIIFSIVTVSLILILFIFRNGIIGVLAEGFTSDAVSLSVSLFMILLPTVMLYSLVSIGTSYMQVNGKFIISSLATVVFNLVFLFGIIYCFIFRVSTKDGVYIISFSVLFSVFAMVLLIYCNINGEKIRYHDYKISDLKVDNNLFKLFIPYCGVLFISQTVLYYERYLASKFQSGTVAALSYSFRLSQFPIWIFVSAIGTVIFPMLSKYSTSGKSKEMIDTFKRSIWIVLVLTVPITILLYILKKPLVEILFLRGAFDSSSLDITIEILSGYIFVILGQSITAISIKMFLAKEEIKAPLIIYFFSSIINMILDNFLVKTIGIGGVGYGAAISSMINALMMIYISKISIMDSINKNIKKITKLVLANFPVILICYYGNVFLNLSSYGNSFLLKFIYLAVIAVIALVSYVVSLKFLKLL